MSKVDSILELQEILKSLKLITTDLDRDIAELKNILNAQEFIPSALGDTIKTRLEMIEENQSTFVVKYESLNNCVPIKKIDVLENQLEEEKKRTEANKEYIDAIDFFCSIHSEDEKTESILQNRKEQLASYNFDTMDEATLKTLANPYVYFKEAYFETDAKKKFSLTYRLATSFEEEIAIGIQFGTLIVKDVSDETKKVDDSNSSIISDEENVNIDFSNEDEDSAVDVITSEATEESNLDSAENMEELNALYYKEVSSNLHVETTSKANVKFGVKEFKNEIIKQIPEVKLDCMVEALKGCGYSLESIVELKEGNLDEYSLATDKLYQTGYLKKYTIDNLGEFYTLSLRGERAFFAKEALNFINQHRREKISAQDLGEHIEDTTNSAIVRLLSFESVQKLQKIMPGYEIKSRKHFFGTDYFVVGYPLDLDEERFIYFTGVVTESNIQLQEWKDGVTTEIEENDILIVSGVNTDHVKATANWLMTDWGAAPTSVAYTIGGNDLIYNLSTDAIFEIDSSEILEEGSVSEEDSVYAAEEILDKTDGTVEEIIKSEKTETESQNDSTMSDVFESSLSNETESDASLKENEIFKSKIDENIHKSLASVMPSLSEEEKKTHISNYQKMIVSDNLYAASAYLKVLTNTHSYFEPHYRQLAYAVNDPMESCTYSSDTIFNVFYGDSDTISDYYIVAAALRNFFLDQYSYDYSIQQLYTMLNGNQLLRNNQALEALIYDLMKFKNEQHKGVDRYADYREKERGSWEKRLSEICREAKNYYDNYKSGNLKENASHKRFIQTTKLLLGAESDLCQYLGYVAADDRSILDMLQDFLATTYVKDQAAICEENIDSLKINASLDYFWDLASQNMRVVKKTSDLMSSLRTNLYKKVHKVVSVLCNYVFIMNSSFTNIEDTVLLAYKKIRTTLLNNIKEAIDSLSNHSFDELDEMAGKTVLTQTLLELEQRLTGEYKEGSYKYYYIGFLESNKIVLDEDYLPVLDEVLELPDYSLMARIQMHCDAPKENFGERLKSIFDGGDDYGSAALILNYLNYRDIQLSDDEYDHYNIEKAIVFALRDLEGKRKEFIEDIELAQSYGQIDNTVENSKETILQIIEGWYVWAKETRNYGFFVSILEEFRKKIKKDAQYRAQELNSNLSVFLNKNTDWEEDGLIKKAVIQIQERIEQQNYAAAEDLLNRILTQDLDLETSVLQEDYLSDFLDEYDIHYKKTANSGTTLKSLVKTSKTNKDIKGGNRLLENWPRGFGVGEATLKNLLSALGFNLESVCGEDPILGKIENYYVVLKKPQNGRKSNYKHPISAFGSEAEEKGFRVVCIFGKTDASRLIDIFKEIGTAKNTLVLLDYALSLADRRTLARKTKTDMTGTIFAVIDRVALLYLAKHYSETAINRMLMSIVMPFASYQPYIDKSADVMPQEIFIGRKIELHKIESPTGVNIVYGGRQLGKSALLRMAKKDINHNENGDRAILVDIKGSDYKVAAKKISAALYDEGILLEEHITDDWNELARDIKKRLRDTTDYIPYLLLLMDEADVFIESCESVGYQPFDALKDIQSVGSGRFKFVVAGLRNIVRFKREAALGNNSVITHLDSLTVKPFKSMEARELLEVPLSYLGFRFPNDNETEVLISTIFGTTNYFPGLLQLYCAKLIEAMRRDYAGYSESETPPYVVKKDHIKKVLAEQSLQQDIREKFFITLKVGEDDYYYIIALLVAYHYHENKAQNGCSVKDLLELANTYSIGKLASLDNKKLSALMEEMSELNVLQHTGDGRYRFTRHSFCQMMGTVQQIDDELMNYMED